MTVFAPNGPFSISHPKLAGAAFEGNDLKVSLSAQGNANTALTLVNSPAENAEVWARLLTPRWAAPTVALPSGEVLLSVTQGKRTAPMLAFQRYGAGRVLYASFDEPDVAW